MSVDERLSMSFAYGPSLGVWAPGIRMMGDDKANARQIVNAVAKDLSRQDVLATPVVADGDPKQVLLKEAERMNADCIFLGAKGHSRMERFLLGSVSAAVAARARCSVEVVRQG